MAEGLTKSTETKSTYFTDRSSVIFSEWLNWVDEHVRQQNDASYATLNGKISDLQARVTLLEGGSVPGPTPAPTPAPVPTNSFDFYTGQVSGSEALPAGVTFTRASTGYARAYTGVQTLYAIDTPRWSYNMSQGLLGLAFESTKNNILTYGLKPGSTGWSTVGSGMNITADVAIAPDGNTTGTRVIFPVVGVTLGSHLLRLNVSGFSATESMARSVWLKSLSGRNINLSTRTVDGQELEVIQITTSWARYDVNGLIPTSNINFDIGSAGAENHGESFAVWGATMYEDHPTNGWTDYPHDTATDPVTRDKDELTFTVTAGTYDVEITWANNDTIQTLYSADCTSGSFVLDPDSFSPYGISIKKVEFVLPAGPAPAPPPTDVETEASNFNNKDTMIADMYPPNDGTGPHLYRYKDVLPNGNAGWSRGPVITTGADLRGNYKPSWYYDLSDMSKPSLTDPVNYPYWRGLFPWFVCWTGEDHGSNSSNTRMMIEQMEVLVLRDGQTTWEKLTHVNQTDAELFPRGIEPDGAVENTIDRRSETDNRFSYKHLDNGNYVAGVSTYPDDYIIHGWHNAGHFNVRNPENVKGIMSRCIASLILEDSSGTDDRLNADYLLSVGLDNFPNATEFRGSLFPNGFVPASGGSRFKKVTIAPQEFCYVNVDPSGTLNEQFYEIWTTGNTGYIGSPMGSERKILNEADFTASTIPDFGKVPK